MRAQWDHDLSELVGGSSDPDAGKLANRIEAHILGLEREAERLRAYWRPIASAPKDGSVFLIERDYPSDNTMSFAFWHDGQNVPGWVHTVTGIAVDLNIYTMWRPKPSVPALASQSNVSPQGGDAPGDAQ